MMYKNRYPKKQNRKRLIYLTFLVVVICIAIAIALLKFNQKEEPTVNQVGSEAETTSTEPSAQNDFTTEEEREPGNTLKENHGSATIKDTGGETQSEPNINNSIVSDTGEITVYSPEKNSTVGSGVTVTGVSKLNRISFRIVDNISGVISRGELKVVNGKFSGTMEFDTNATEGRIDLFGTRNDGTEYSNIKIPIKFK